MARKLRIYTGERHDFEGHPQLQTFTMPPRKLRVKGELFELPPGFEPFNPQAYYVSAMCWLAEHRAGCGPGAGAAVPCGQGAHGVVFVVVLRLPACRSCWTAHLWLYCAL